MNKNTSYNEKDIVPIMEEVIKSGGSCKLRVTGYSMNPTLRHLKDSVVLVSPQKRKTLKNEIVFIKRDSGKHVLHRIIKIIDNGLGPKEKKENIPTKLGGIGMENVNKIAETKTDYSDRPMEDQRIKTMTVETFGVEYPEPDKM